MALEGNAGDFGLSEIFQLISIQKKSGMLSISGRQNMAIFFENGMVISTRDRRAKTCDPLRDYLIRYGFIGSEEMNNLQQIQAGSGMDLTDILLSERYFSEDELRQIFTDQTYETIQEILSWPKSYYKFISGTNVLTGVRSFAEIKVEGVLMESMRRIDEFPQIERIFPHAEMMVRRLEMKGDEETKLERAEEIVYELLEQERSIRDLVANARMARFCTYEALKNLLDKELLEITRDTGPQQQAESGEERAAALRPAARARLAPTLATVVILVACFALGEFALPALLPPGWTAGAFAPRAAATPRGGPTSLPADLEEFRLRRLETTARQAIEEHRAVSGAYPFSLEVLVVKKILRPATLARINQAGLVYRTAGGDWYSLERR